MNNAAMLEIPRKPMNEPSENDALEQKIAEALEKWKRENYEPEQGWVNSERR